MWFHSVMSKTTLSLYELDVKFDIKYDELVTDKLRADKRRRKIFEDLRDRYILPFKNDLDVFLDQVENTDGFENTAKFYRSYFWQLTQPKPLEINQLRSIVFQIFQSYSLFEKVIKTNKQKVSKSNENSDYINGLITLLKNITFSLDKLALIVALFREAYLVGNISLADEIFSLYQLYVELITESDDIHVSLKDDFFKICASRLLSQYLDKLPEHWAAYDEMIGSSFKRSFARKFLRIHDENCWISHKN